MSRTPFKTCTCCQRRISPLEWSQLPLLGWQSDDVETLELRDCLCGSTIAVVLSPAPVPRTVSPEVQTGAPS